MWEGYTLPFQMCFGQFGAMLSSPSNSHSDLEAQTGRVLTELRKAKRLSRIRDPTPSPVLS